MAYQIDKNQCCACGCCELVCPVCAIQTDVHTDIFDAFITAAANGMTHLM